MKFLTKVEHQNGETPVDDGYPAEERYEALKTLVSGDTHG